MTVFESLVFMLCNWTAFFGYLAGLKCLMVKVLVVMFCGDHDIYMHIKMTNFSWMSHLRFVCHLF